MNNETKEENVTGQNEESVNLFKSTEIRELYTITPPVSFTDSGEEEDGCYEVSPLMENELAFESTSSADLPKTSSLEGTSCETRPLLSRQLEIDQDSQSSKDANVHSFDRVESMEKSSEECHHPNIPSALNISTSDDELESQRATPILFKLSPTKKGASKVVSVVATRELPPAFSRSSSMPSSPCIRKPKSPRKPISPKSFRSLLGFCDSFEKDSSKGFSVLNPKTPNGENASMSKTAVHDCIVSTVNDGPNRGNVSLPVNEATAVNGDVQMNCEAIANEYHKASGCIRNRHYGNTFHDTEKKEEVLVTSSKSDKFISPEDPAVVFHSEPFPARLPVLPHQTVQRDSASEKGSNTNDSLEESTNNSDKGYESVDNSNSVETEESASSLAQNERRMLNTGIAKLSQNGVLENVLLSGVDDISAVPNKPPESEGSVWVPLDVDPRTLEGRKRVSAVAASQPTCNLFSQTAV